MLQLFQIFPNGVEPLRNPHDSDNQLPQLNATGRMTVDSLQTQYDSVRLSTNWCNVFLQED